MNLPMSPCLMICVTNQFQDSAIPPFGSNWCTSWCQHSTAMSTIFFIKEDGAPECAMFSNPDYYFSAFATTAVRSAAVLAG